MRVAHITLSFSRGGRREAIASLAAGLRPLGVASVLVTVDALGADEHELAPLFDGWTALRRRGRLDRAARAALAAFVRTQRVDIVHTHDASSQFEAALALPWASLPVLMTFHRSSDVESSSLRSRLRNALAALRCAAIVTGSDERRRHFLAVNRVASSKLEVIPFGIDTTRFKPDPEARARVLSELGLDPALRLVGCVGHFGLDKGVDIAIDAFQRHLDATPDSPHALCVLGTGAPGRREALEAQIAPSHAARIRFAGFRADTERWFPAFDALLHGARREAFGLVIVEAMASGVPVVATAVGGIPEIVVDGTTGQLTPALDPASLARALGAVLADEGARQAMAAAAHVRVRELYTRERYAQRHVELYRRLLGSTRQSRA